MKEALRRAIAIRDGINRKTGYPDTNITDGVNHLLTDDKHVFIPQFQVIENPTDVNVIFDDDPFETLEYLESSATSTSSGQYIDTGFKPTPKTRIVIDMQYTERNNSYGQLMGSGYNNISGNSGRFSFFFGMEHSAASTGANNFYSNIIDSQNYAWNYYNIGDLNRHVWDLQSGSQKVDNVEYGTQIIPVDKTSNLNLWLFGRLCSWDNNHNYCDVRIFSCQIYDDGILVRDYLAKRNKYTNAIGLFDEVNQNLNTGSGTFTPGPIISGGEQ